MLNAKIVNCEKPLVSFCVKCYNQREYICDALDGAFAQTYRPLEIVISDDGSSDGSIETIRRKIDEYYSRGGDIPVFFNCNEKNLGNVGSWIVFGGIAHGELLVKADGDDISMPQRVEKIVDAWVANGKKAKLIDHVAVDMDAKGRATGGIRKFLGAAQAYSRECWDRFSVKGEMPPHNWVGDDIVFSIRACAIAGIDNYQLVMDDRLVWYRCGSGATTKKKNYRDVIDTYVKECCLYGLHDIELNKDSLDPDIVDATCSWCLCRANEAGLIRQLAKSSLLRERISAALSLRSDFGRKSFRDAIFQIMLILPPKLTNPFLDFYLGHIRRT